MLNEGEWDRLRWQCRRGMLELDVILLPFVEEDLSRLDERLQRGFARLLESSDLQLFRWLLRGEQSADAELHEMIEVILAHHQARHPGWAIGASAVGSDCQPPVARCPAVGCPAGGLCQQFRASPLAESGL